MKTIMAKIVLFTKAFLEEKDRSKKEVIAKQISNLCSINYKDIAQGNSEVAKLIYPLIALGYFKVNDNKFDPDPKELEKIMKKLQKYL